MARKTRVLAASGVALALGLTTAACGGGSDSDNNSNGNSNGKSEFGAAITKVVNPSTTKGGTLNLWTSQDADSWDPARGYYAFVWNLNRLYTRKLVDYASTPRKDGLKLQPDLAEAEPTISADKLTYTFKLRSGLKWDDGSPITSKDVKYGVERVWAADVINGGPVYLPGVLDQGLLPLVALGRGAAAGDGRHLVSLTRSAIFDTVLRIVGGGSRFGACPSVWPSRSPRTPSCWSPPCRRWSSRSSPPSRRTSASRPPRPAGW